MIPASILHRPSTLNSSAFAPLLTTTGPGRHPGPAAWCPTMDLLALSSAGGRLAVRRLDWTRLWSARVGSNAPSSAKPAAAAAPSASSSSASASASVTALAWRPDGRALAVASSCGGLEVRATEDGEVLASLSGGGARSPAAAAAAAAGPTRFVALSWATDGGEGPAAAAGLSLRDSLVASGPPLPPCPLPAPQEFEERSGEVEAPEGAEAAAGAAASRPRAPPPRHEPSSLQVLAAADSEGVVHLFGPRLTPLARLPVAAAAAAAAKGGRGRGDGEGAVEIRAVALSTGLDSLHVLLASLDSPPSSDGPGGGAASESLFLATVDTRALARARRELTRVLHAAGHALSLLSVASRSAEAAAAHWREAEGILEREVLAKLEKLRADFGEGDATEREREGDGNGRIGLGGRIGGSSARESAPPSPAPRDLSSAVACLSKAALCGAVSAPLAHFWESDPGPRGLRAAARSSDAACRAASELVRATTEPALEGACYFVGELQRVAEASGLGGGSSGSGVGGGIGSKHSSGEGGGGAPRRWGSALGLRPREAAEAARRARDAAAAAAAARAAVAEGVASSRALFLWLMSSAARVTTTAAAAAAAAGGGGEGDGEDGGAGAPRDEAGRAAAARAAARAAAAVLPRGDPLAATRALSGSVAVNPRLAAAAALGRGGGGGAAAAAAAAGADEREAEALRRASCDPAAHPGVPAAALDALGRRSWPPAGQGTMRNLALAASSAVEGVLAAVCERLSAEMTAGVERAAGSEAALGRGERRGQVCLVAADDDGSSSSVRAAAAFIAPGGGAAVAARAVAAAGGGGSGGGRRGRRPPLVVEVAAVAPIVVGAASAAAEEAGGEGEKHISPPRVVGVGLYRGHALVLLSDGGGKGSGGEGGAAATLALVTADELPFSPQNTTVGVEKKGKGVAAARCRLVVSSSSFSSDASAAPPLAVSASRGVACALTAAGTRATVFDLEEDDDDEDEEEGGGAEEGEEGGAKSSDYGDDDDDGDDHRRHHHESDDSSSLSDGSSGSGGMSSE